MEPRAPTAASAASSSAARAAPERGDVAQPVRPDRREVDARGERQQRLVRADVAGRLLAPDVLLAGAHRHDERARAVEVGGHARRAGPGSGERAHRSRRGSRGTGRRTAGAIPSGWPSPAAMSAPYSPGGASTASETGSTTATNSAPAAWASGRSRPSARAARGSWAGRRRPRRPAGPGRRAAARARRGPSCRPRARPRPAGSRRPRARPAKYVASVSR